MLGFVARRLLHLLPVLLAVSLLTFLIASLLPGDLAYVILGDQATPDKVEALRHDDRCQRDKPALADAESSDHQYACFHPIAPAAAGAI